MRKVNRRIVVAERPRYIIPTANVFNLTEAPVPEPGAGEMLIRTTWVGIDSYLYRRVQQSSSLGEPIPIGGVMAGAAVGRVEQSNHPEFKAGELVHGFWGWQDYHVSGGGDVAKVDPEIPRPSYLLGALGISGFGAYIAVNELVKTRAGEVLTIGSALGGLGQIVGQLGKLKGAQVLAGASGAEKCRYALEQYHFDVCLDRKAKDFLAQVKAVYSKYGIDCYVMAAGGKVLDIALPYFRRNARIAVCGMMATYGQSELPPGGDRTVLLLNEIIVRRLRISGLVTTDWLGTPLHQQFKKEMKDWILAGKIKPLEHVVEGLEHAPDMMQGLFEGRNFGKVVVRVAD